MKFPELPTPALFVVIGDGCMSIRLKTRQTTAEGVGIYSAKPGLATDREPRPISPDTEVQHITMGGEEGLLRR